MHCLVPSSHRCPLIIYLFSSMGHEITLCCAAKRARDLRQNLLEGTLPEAWRAMADATRTMYVLPLMLPITPS